MRKILVAVTLTTLIVSAHWVHADIYQWTDSEGVVHFTDDPDAIPKSYRHKAARRETDHKVKVPPPSAPTLKPAPPSSAPGEIRYGGWPEDWWRQQFAGLKGQVQSLQASIDKKQSELAELKHKRVIYMRARDRVAINNKQAEIEADQARLQETQQRLATLEHDANVAGVPSGWRQ